MAGVTGGVTGGAFTVKGAGGGVALVWARAACCSACSRSARVHGSSSWFRCQPRLAPRCCGSALARLFVQVGSAAGCCDHHVPIGFGLWNWCMPSMLVVVGLVNIWHGRQRQVGCAIRHGNQVTVEW